MSSAASPMDHAYVERHGLLARYSSRELDGEEVDAFEIHFLDCAICRAELDTDLALRDGFQAAAAEGLLTEPQRARRSPYWLLPYALAASALAAVTTGLLLRQGLSSPASVPTQVVALTPLRQQSNAETVRLRIDNPKELVVFVIDGVQPELARYAVRIADVDGKVLWNDRDVLPRRTLDADRLVVSIPAGSLPSGTAKLTVEGRPRDGNPPRQVQTAAFRLQIERE
jgi:hypothetical protein